MRGFEESIKKEGKRSCQEYKRWRGDSGEGEEKGRSRGVGGGGSKRGRKRMRGRMMAS